MTVYGVFLNSFLESVHATALSAQAAVEAIRTSPKFKAEDWRVNGHGIWSSQSVKSLRQRGIEVEA
jgi:hypothetical protein